MRRGVRKLTSLIPDVGNNSVSLNRKKERNSAIAYRFYFYKTQSRLNYECIIGLIARDFFLADITVFDILSRNSSLITAAKNEKLSSFQLSRKYPQLNWNFKALTSEIQG
jgi:hypothetical protein